MEAHLLPSGTLNLRQPISILLLEVPISSYITIGLSNNLGPPKGLLRGLLKGPSERASKGGLMGAQLCGLFFVPII